MKRLERIQEYLLQQGWPFQYEEENDCGSIEFVHRGLAYHIWEYPEPERGAASNVRSAGRMLDYEGDYESAILAVLKGWQSPIDAANPLICHPGRIFDSAGVVLSSESRDPRTVRPAPGVDCRRLLRPANLAIRASFRARWAIPFPQSFSRGPQSTCYFTELLLQ